MQNKANTMNVEKYIEKLKRFEYLSAEDTKLLIEKSKEVFTREENVVNAEAPVTVCGDIHGQFHDLLELFSICGQIPFTR